MEARDCKSAEPEREGPIMSLEPLCDAQGDSRNVAAIGE
jgi:hypothetical protein